MDVGAQVTQYIVSKGVHVMMSAGYLFFANSGPSSCPKNKKDAFCLFSFFMHCLPGCLIRAARSSCMTVLNLLAETNFT